MRLTSLPTLTTCNNHSIVGACPCLCATTRGRSSHSTCAKTARQGKASMAIAGRRWPPLIFWLCFGSTGAARCWGNQLTVGPSSTPFAGAPHRRARWRKRARRAPGTPRSSCWPGPGVVSRFAALWQRPTRRLVGLLSELAQTNDAHTSLPLLWARRIRPGLRAPCANGYRHVQHPRRDSVSAICAALSALRCDFILEIFE